MCRMTGVGQDRGLHFQTSKQTAITNISIWLTRHWGRQAATSVRRERKQGWGTAVKSSNTQGGKVTEETLRPQAEIENIFGKKFPYLYLIWTILLQYHILVFKHHTFLSKKRKKIHFHSHSICLKPKISIQNKNEKAEVRTVFKKKKTY